MKVSINHFHPLHWKTPPHLTYLTQQYSELHSILLEIEDQEGDEDTLETIIFVDNQLSGCEEEKDTESADSGEEEDIEIADSSEEGNRALLQ